MAMIFNIGQYIVEVLNNDNDAIDQYDSFYTSNSDYFSSCHLIRLFKDDELIKSVCVKAGGGPTGIQKSSLVIEVDRLAICCGDTVFCTALPTLSLLWKTIADSATCFEIFNWHGDYIVHGELEITRLDKSGNIIWQHSGRDIFTTLNGKGDFKLFPEYVEVTDWDSNVYQFDFEGNILKS